MGLRKWSEMQFHEKLKSLRVGHALTQVELAKQLTITQRALVNYETGKRIPNHATLMNIANFFGVSIDYLLTREEEFVQIADEKFGSKGKKRATQLLADTNSLFAGGDLGEEDKDAFFKAISDIYFESKTRAKKFAPKKTRRTNHPEEQK